VRPIRTNHVSLSRDGCANDHYVCDVVIRTSIAGSRSTLHNVCAQYVRTMYRCRAMDVRMTTMFVMWSFAHRSRHPDPPCTLCVPNTYELCEPYSRCEPQRCTTPTATMQIWGQPVSPLAARQPLGGQAPQKACPLV
jgi:hypothetical protein